MMRTRILFSSAAIGALFFLGAAAPAASAASIFDITYPIPELGNCADRLACKAYCNDSANQSVCQSFAADHGLAVKPAAPQASEQDHDVDQNAALQALEKDGGPGKCASGAADPQAACRAYCDASSHIEECVQYGKDHGILSGEQLAQAEKVMAALKNGIPLPSGCTNQASCKQTCENPSSLDQAKSCLAFGKAAGLLPPGFDESKAEKVFSAVQNGTAPFSSMKDFQQCEHPTDPTIIKKCSDFAVQSGFMTQQQADVLQETGGKGPGGCSGQDACEQYCADHQDECFQFSEKHNLVTPEQKSVMQRAASQIQNALSRVPDSVRECLVDVVGQGALDAITSGAKPGTPQLGQAMQQCFEQDRNDSQMQERQGPPPQSFNQGGARPPPPNEQPGYPLPGQQGFMPPNSQQGPGWENPPRDGRGPSEANQRFYPMPPIGAQGDQGRRFMPMQNGNENAPQWQQDGQGAPQDRGQNYPQMNYGPRPESGPGPGGYGDQNLGNPSMPPVGQSGPGTGAWNPPQGQTGENGGGNFMMPPPGSDLNNPPPDVGQMPPPPGGMVGAPPPNTNIAPTGEVAPPPPPLSPSSPTSFSYPFNSSAAAAFFPFISH